MKLRVLHLEDNANDVELVRSTLERGGIECDILAVSCASDYLSALERSRFDLILSDSSVPGYDGSAALGAARDRCPTTPFIVLSGSTPPTPGNGRNGDGTPTARVAKTDLAGLVRIIRRVAVSAQGGNAAVSAPDGADVPDATGSYLHGMQQLVATVQRLSLARDLPAIVEIVRHAARSLVSADGATFVLRDGDQCFYLDEDAIAPLWKGHRFPMQACISGWAMLNRQPAVIDDIYQDARIPHDAYRPTFVRSLVMMPIRTVAPIGAIGVYWAHTHLATPAEVELLQALADSTSVAMEAADVFATLERRVAERTAELNRRTAELEVLNHELEAFSYSVAHDLRSPLITIDGFTQVLLEHSSDTLDETGREHLERITGAVRRMHRLINDLLDLSRIVRTPMQFSNVDLSQIAREIAQSLQQSAPGRNAQFIIGDDIRVEGDPGLLRIALENLLANAWKFSSAREMTRIEVAKATDRGGHPAYVVKDNGAGFDPRYASKLFSPFQRLHPQSQFPGTGIGLATVQRIIHRHGGKIWAEAAIDHGASFYFTLT
jgi:signal transduction histidine kinase